MGFFTDAPLPPTGAGGETQGFGNSARADADLVRRIADGRSTKAGAGRAIARWPGDLLSLASMNESQLRATLGITASAASRVLLAFALHRRLLASALEDVVMLGKPELVARLIIPLAQLDHERLWCLAMAPRNRLIGEPIEVARGDVDAVDASVRAICRAALRAGASSMIVCHNHPTGDPTPSACDAAITSRLAAAGRTVDVPLSDHVIVCANGRWCSLRQTQPGLFR